MNIRPETKQDKESIYKINCEAFGTDIEAKIVDALRDSGQLKLSMVAEDHGNIIGHIAYSPMTFPDARIAVNAVALAPMSVAPAFQRKGVGSRLINISVEELKRSNVDIIFLIGHPEYYPKFGFQPAFSTLGVKSNFEDVPDDAFMYLKISENPFKLENSRVFFRDEFSESL